MTGLKGTAVITDPPPDFAGAAKRFEDAVALVECALHSAAAIDLSADKDALKAARLTLQQGVAAVYAVLADLAKLNSNEHPIP